jgi:GT2 family glycosyltransferase
MLRASVVIATYNQSDLLKKTLLNLAEQSVPVQDFEVIVADDGSTDDTRAIVEEFELLPHLHYFFQEDKGYWAGAARNGGAAMARAPILIFLDTGSLAGPEFVASHLATHQSDAPRAVIGISYGYNPEAPMAELPDIIYSASPAELVARYGDEPAFQDIRHHEFVSCGFDVNRRVVPWIVFWSGNCSMLTENFHAVGGFDEAFVGWGGEDIELGYRLQASGIELVVSRAAWAVVAPHERDVGSNDEEFARNMDRFLAKSVDPFVEIGCSITAQYLFWPWETEAQRLAEWTAAAGGLSVTDEIRRALESVEPHERVAVVGCGAELPDSLSPAILIDFDRELLRQAGSGGEHVGFHALGVRTPLQDGEVDVVIITSRLAGLWDVWGPEILKEADRVGARTVVFDR